jgi:hypothetical protein
MRADIAQTALQAVTFFFHSNGDMAVHKNTDYGTRKVDGRLGKREETQTREDRESG